jgi:hypothetical protein
MAGTKTIGIDLLLRVQSFFDSFKKVETESKAGTRRIADGFKQIDDEVEKFGSKLGGLKSKLGDLAIGGLTFAGIGAGISGAMTTMKELDAASDSLSISLSKAGLSGEELDNRFASLEEASGRIGNAFAVDGEEVMMLQAKVVGMSNLTGDAVNDLVEIALGTQDAFQMSAEGIATLIAKGANPEVEGQLKKLGIVFDKNATAAERLQIVQQKLGPAVQATKDSTQDAVGAFDRISLAFADITESGVLTLFELLAPAMDLVVPIAQAMLAAISEVASVIQDLPGPIKLVVAGVALLTAGIFAYTAAQQSATLTMIKDIAVQGAKTVATIAGTIATGAATVATWALNVALAVLTSPITLVVVGIGLLIGIVFALVDGLDAVIGAIKDAANWLGSLVGLVGDETEAVKENVTALDKSTEAREREAEAMAKQRQQLDAFLEGRKREREGVANALQEAEDTLEGIKVRLARGGEYQFDPLGKMTLVQDAADVRATLQANVDDWQRRVDDLRAIKKQEEDIGNSLKPEEAKERTLMQMYQDKVKRIRTEEELNEKTLAVAIQDIKELTDEITGATEEQKEVRAMLTRAVEEETKRQLELVEKAQVDELDAMRRTKIELQKSLDEKLLAIQEAVDDEAITQAQGAQLRMLARKKFDEDSLKAEQDHNRKVYDEALKSMQDTLALREKEAGMVSRTLNVEIFTVREALIRRFRQSQLDLLAQSNLDAKAKHAERIRIESEFNSAMLSINQARIDADRELADLKVKNSDASEVDKQLAYAQNAYDRDMKMLQEQLDAKTISFELFEQKRLALSRDYADKRVGVLKQELAEENLLYQVASRGIKTMLDNTVRQVRLALGLEKAAVKENTEENIAIKEKELEVKIAKLKEEVQQSKMSYEEYILEKMKLEKEFNDFKRGNSEEEKTVFEEALAAMQEMFIESLAKMMQQEIEYSIKRILLKESEAQAAATASLFGSVPNPFIALLLQAGLMLAVSTIFSALKPKGAAMGLLHDPLRDGRDGQLIAIGETGKKEFVAPEVDFLTYAREQLTPMLNDIFKDGLLGGDEQSNGITVIVTGIGPDQITDGKPMPGNVTSGKSPGDILVNNADIYACPFDTNTTKGSSKDIQLEASKFKGNRGGLDMTLNPLLGLTKTMASLESLLTELNQNGIRVHGTSKIMHDHIEIAYKLSQRDVVDRAYTDHSVN